MLLSAMILGAPLGNALAAPAQRVNPFGVATAPWHLVDGDLERSVRLMAEAGAAWMRLDFVWQDLEPAPGRFQWQRYERIVEAAERAGLGLIALVPQYHVPAWARDGAAWNRPPRRAEDYGALVEALARHFRGRIRYYEIGNEPNSSAFWAPRPDVARYGALLRAAYQGIKAGDPQAQVVAGGAAPWGPTFVDPVTWLRHLVRDGIPFDAVAAHPYSAPHSPEDDRPTYARLSLVRDLYGVLTQHGQPTPILITEFGWSTARHPHGVSDALQAQYLARAFTRLEAAFPYVVVACVYAFRDAGTDPTDPEDHFGLVTRAYQPKPAFRAFQAAARAVRDAAAHRP